MDFQTKKGLSRNDIRLIAKIIRKNFKIRSIRFPVMKMLEKFVTKFEDILIYDINPDNEFEEGVQAYLEAEDETFERFCIHIKESVYINAIAGRGDCLDHICHELSHFILIYLCGILPDLKFKRDLAEKIPAYKSAEWQAKALCGELMIPYDECKDKTYRQIRHITKCSKEQTNYFLNFVANKQ